MKLAMQKARVTVKDMRRVRPTPKQADPFYTGAVWRELCDLLKETRWPQLIVKQGHCCEDPDCTAEHRLGQRIYFDHIVELRDGGAPLDPDNVMGRCGSSHVTKTNRERALRLGASPDREGGSKV